MAKFKIGDKVIWFKPVEMKVIEYDKSDETFRCEVVRDRTDSSKGEKWWFTSDGIWNTGELETHGVIVHPGATITSGPEPKRKLVYQFNDKDIVLVRDLYNEPWKIAVFKREWKDVPHPYYVYDREGRCGETPYTFCIPFAGNKHKLGEVTED